MTLMTCLQGLGSRLQGLVPLVLLGEEGSVQSGGTGPLSRRGAAAILRVFRQLPVFTVVKSLASDLGPIRWPTSAPQVRLFP